MRSRVLICLLFVLGALAASSMPAFGMPAARTTAKYQCDNLFSFCAAMLEGNGVGESEAYGWCANYAYQYAGYDNCYTV